MKKLALGMFAMVLAIGVRAAAQTASADPAFEAASVRPSTSGYAGWRLEPQPGGRLTGTNVPASALIRFAYDLPAFQISGPDWLDDARFDIAATAGTEASIDRRRLMLRGLLAERFKLAAHTETHELPIYVLTIARSDGKTGPQLRRAADCSRAELPWDLGVGPSPRDGPPACGYFGMAPGTDLPKGRGGLAFRGMTLGMFAKRLMPLLRRTVSDRTGLTGYFDGEFDFVAELPPPPPPPGMPSAFGSEPFATIFTVLPEQLGLKLESRRGPVDVLVIDRVERPAPD